MEKGIKTKDDSLVIIDSKEYIIIDSKALSYILENFSTVDYGRILQMSDMTNGCYNILHKDKFTPHNDESLMKEIKYSRNKYLDFMKRLYDNGVVYYLKGKKNGVEFKHIMLNPYLARKRKTISQDCIQYFQELK